MNLFSSIAKETGLSEGTPYPWRKRACSNGLAIPSGEIETERWSIRDKFNIVLETATLSKVELAEYCRSKGLFAEQVKAWQEACMQANGGIVKKLHWLKQLRYLFYEKKPIRFGGTAGTPDQRLRSHGSHTADHRTNIAGANERTACAEIGIS